jgi:hypothetical protein
MFFINWLYCFLYGKDQHDAVNSRNPPRVLPPKVRRQVRRRK